MCTAGAELRTRPLADDWLAPHANEPRAARSSTDVERPLDNSISGSLGTNQAAVRFVNLAPGTANPFFTVFTGVLGAGGTITTTWIAAGAPTTFNTVTSGSNAFTILSGHDIVIARSAATLNLQGGSVNTLAMIPNTSGGFQLINLPRCA